jgi:hypothetical protein
MSSYFKTNTNENANLTIFALPVIRNNEQLMTRYASKVGDTFGVLPLTLFDINSYRRLQKIFFKTILEFETEKCPYCGRIMRQTENGRSCNECNLIVTTTTCRHEDCCYEYQYTWYSISGKNLSAMRNITESDFFNRDSLFQYKDIVPMQVKENLVPVCPKCMR